MEFTLTAEQQQFAASLQDMLAAADTPTAAREWAAGNREPGRKIWHALAAAGATALAIPAASGGLGAHPADLVIACEVLGEHAVPGPVAESLAAIPVLLAAAGAGARLPELAAGDLVGTLAAPPLLPYAADADTAGLVLLGEPDTAGPPGRAARLWTAAATGVTFRSVDPSRTLSEVAPGELLAQGPAVARAIAAALEYGTLASAAQLLGAGRALLAAAARHARERVQFGRPVGSFQAVQHRLADVLIALEFARPLVFGAAVALAGNPASAARDVSAARIASADAAQQAARAALQVHGALGYTAEHDVGRWLTKVTALRSAWGTQAYHRARVLASITADGEPEGGGPACG